MLLDLLMPVMDGWEFRAEQLKNPDIADIPVIVMSAADVDFETLHAAASFPKPFRVAELLDEVRARDAGA